MAEKPPSRLVSDTHQGNGNRSLTGGHLIVTFELDGLLIKQRTDEPFLVTEQKEVLQVF